MTNEELVKLYQSGERQALNELVQKNSGIVYKLVNKFYTDNINSIDREDLIQEGFTGLMVAADKYKFDIDNRAKFSTYAVFWIYQKIYRFITVNNTNDEVSLNVTINEDDDKEYIESIDEIDYGFENVEEKLYLQQLRSELDQVMNECATLKEKEIIKLRYGWDNNDVMTFKEAGGLLNVSGSAIRQMEVNAFMKIRRSVWGAIKANEIYAEKKEKSMYSIPGAIENMNFAQKYLTNKVR